MTTPLTRTQRGLALALASSGVLHLVRPETFASIVPKVLPEPRDVVYASGVAELLCGVGLLIPRTRRAAGVASAATLLAIWPANGQMSVDAVQAARRRPTTRRTAFAAGTVARLPLQWPLIRAAWRAGR